MKRIATVKAELLCGFGKKKKKKQSGGTTQWVKVIIRINEVNLFACVSASIPRISGRGRKLNREKTAE